jgi:hypothetical protein
MSKEEDKRIHSKRLQKDENAIKKQKKIAEHYGMTHTPEHSYAKRHSMNCGNPDCFMCGNPRKFFGEVTPQEKRMIQDLDDVRNKRSNGLDGDGND